MNVPRTRNTVLNKIALGKIARAPIATASKSTTLVKRVIVGALAAIFLGILPAGVTTGAANPFGQPAAAAQNFSQRTIQGKVVDDTGTLVGGATVFLKDVKTRSVKSFTSTVDGTFRFAQVGMIDDYEVWAEHTGKKSPTRTVSSFDSRKQVEFELKLK